MITLGPTSLKRLEGVHPDLVRVVFRAAEMAPPDHDFTVLEGVRTLDRQKELFARKATRTLKSRHLTGHAVDLAALLGGKVAWDWPLYYPLAEIVKAAAAAENVPITWGGDWESFKDGPHWELPWSKYP